jgi:hypothetical protein
VVEDLLVGLSVGHGVQVAQFLLVLVRLLLLAGLHQGPVPLDVPVSPRPPGGRQTDPVVHYRSPETNGHVRGHRGRFCSTKTVSSFYRFLALQSSVPQILTHKHALTVFQHAGKKHKNTLVLTLILNIFLNTFNFAVEIVIAYVNFNRRVANTNCASHHFEIPLVIILTGNSVGNNKRQRQNVQIYSYNDFTLNK